MKRFKIDLRKVHYGCPVGLYFRDKTWYGREYWRMIDVFYSIDQAKTRYEQVKDLPQYLD